MVRMRERPHSVCFLFFVLLSILTHLKTVSCSRLKFFLSPQLVEREISKSANHSWFSVSRTPKESFMGFSLKVQLLP